MVDVFRISSRQHGVVEVRAANWLIALGEGLALLGVVDGLDRVACEVLMNGTTLVRDVRRGHGYIVQPLQGNDPAAEGRPQGDASPNEHLDDTEDAGAMPLQQGPNPLLAEWIERIHSARDRRTAVRLAVQGAMALVPAESGTMLLEQPDATLLFAVVAGPEAHKLRNVTLPAGTGVAGFCVDHAVALTVTDPYRDQRFYREVDARTGYRTRSLLCAPVAVAHRVYGCLELINAPGTAGFSTVGLDDATRIADTLAARLAR